MDCRENTQRYTKSGESHAWGKRAPREEINGFGACIDKSGARGVFQEGGGGSKLYNTLHDKQPQLEARVRGTWERSDNHHEVIASETIFNTQQIITTATK